MDAGMELMPVDITEPITAAIGFFNNIVNTCDKCNERDFELQKAAIANERYRMEAQITALQEREATIRREIESKVEMERIHAIEETKRFRIQEQSKCLQKAMDISLAAYNRKIDFYQAQLDSCNSFFGSQIQTLNAEIHALQRKRDEAFNDAEQFNLISNEISRMTDYCKKVNRKWTEFQGKLTDAVKYASLDSPVENGINVFLTHSSFNGHAGNSKNIEGK